MDNYEKFINDLKVHLDLDLTGYKRPQMERRINTLMRTLGIMDYNHFIKSMKEDKGVLERFVDHMTINVSEFFRNPSQWQVLKDRILPCLVEETSSLKVWSAGCSTGEEPYTTAMVLSELLPRGNFSILATDFDPRVLRKAVEGYYLKKNITGLSPEYLQKFFVAEGDRYRVRNELKEKITFKEHNLLRDSYPHQIDLIICRNVVIYFTEDTKSTLYRKFFNSLRPGGILFTGSTEQIIQAREIGYQAAAIFFYRRTA